MADFPSLIPSSRLIQPPVVPITRMRSLGGFEGRIRHSAFGEGGRMALTFLAQSEADMLAIRSHYRGQRGRILPFGLSAEVWSGLPADPTPAGHAWRYLSRPSFEPIGCDLFDTTVELETALSIAPVVRGLDLVIRLSGPTEAP